MVIVDRHFSEESCALCFLVVFRIELTVRKRRSLKVYRERELKGVFKVLTVTAIAIVEVTYKLNRVRGVVRKIVFCHVEFYLDICGIYV